MFTENPEFFDSIAYINVMEHIEDDFYEMQQVHKALKPTGHAIIFKLLRKSLSGENVPIYDRTVIPVVSRLKSIISLPIGKNFLMIVKK